MIMNNHRRFQHFLVGGLVAIFYFPIYWEFHHPNWLTHIFQRGGPTTNQIFVWDDLPTQSSIELGHFPARHLWWPLRSTDWPDGRKLSGLRPRQVLDADTQLAELAEDNEVELTLVVRSLGQLLGFVVFFLLTNGVLAGWLQHCNRW